MSRYIDADKLLVVLDTNSIINKITYSNGKSIREIIQDQPTADVQEVKHEKSIKHKSKLDECSECGCTFVVVSDMDNCYCTHCGAKMDKG